MMKRIQSEITSDETADLWQNKLESMGVVFSHDEFPEGRTFPNYRLSAFFYRKIRRQKEKFFFCLFTLAFDNSNRASVYERPKQICLTPL